MNSIISEYDSEIARQEDIRENPMPNISSDYTGEIVYIESILNRTITNLRVNATIEVNCSICSMWPYVTRSLLGSIKIAPSGHEVRQL